MSLEYAHLSDEQRELVAGTRRIAAEELRPIAEAGEPGRVNRPLVRALAEHGLLGRLFGTAAGSGGEDGEPGGDPPAGGRPANGRPAATRRPAVSAIELCLIREALAIESTESETAFALQGLGSYPVLLAGAPALVERWIPPVAGGEAVAAFALTEPEAGSDVSAIELRAERDGSDWRLSGEKTYISNAPEADLYTIFARTSDAGARGLTAFALPGDAPGLSGEPLSLLAPHPIGRLQLDGALVPGDHLIGELDGGFRVAMRTLDLFRPSVGAFAVGMAQAALDAAVSYAGERRAFGSPIKDFQAVSHRLAEMATRTQAARLLVHAAAGATDAGAESPALLVAMAKLYATEAAQFVVDAAVQVHGARALEQGHLLEHLYREVRAPRIYEGTSEIQREIIARRLYRGG
jgi:alkylation response protein AidB-like acyl-CoA dehydrogenase